MNARGDRDMTRRIVDDSLRLISESGFAAYNDPLDGT